MADEKVELIDLSICFIFTKVIREKSRGGRFLWNKNWNLGWIWAGSATFKAGFLMFSWAKKILKNILDGENIFGIEWN